MIQSDFQQFIFNPNEWNDSHQSETIHMIFLLMWNDSLLEIWNFQK